MSRLHKLTHADYLCSAGSRACDCEICCWFSPSPEDDLCNMAYKMRLNDTHKLYKIAERLAHE